MNGVVRAIRVNKSNNANGSRCSSRYGSQEHSWVNSDVGFRYCEWCICGRVLQEWQDILCKGRN